VDNVRFQPGEFVRQANAKGRRRGLVRQCVVGDVLWLEDVTVALPPAGAKDRHVVARFRELFCEAVQPSVALRVSQVDRLHRDERHAHTPEIAMGMKNPSFERGVFDLLPEAGLFAPNRYDRPTPPQLRVRPRTVPQRSERLRGHVRPERPPSGWTRRASRRSGRSIHPAPGPNSAPSTTNRSPSLPPERPELIFGMDEGGNERLQFYRLDEEGRYTRSRTSQTPNTDGAAGVTMASGSPSPPTAGTSPSSTCTSRTATRWPDANGDDSDAAPTDAAELLFEGDGWLSVGGWSPPTIDCWSRRRTPTSTRTSTSSTSRPGNSTT